MIKYSYNNSFVLRDIAGIYFAIDITDKDIFRSKKITAINKSGYVLLNLASELKTFDVEVYTKKFSEMLKDGPPTEVLKEDIQEFSYEMCKKGIFDCHEK